MDHAQLIAQELDASLGILDSDGTLLRFIIQLYEDVKLSEDPIGNFRKLLAENGGEFPPEFVDKIIDILHVPVVKQEVKEEYSALSIPDRLVKFEEEEYEDRKPIIKEERIRELIPGDVYKGIVTNITHFGAFIAIQHFSGLCHISQMSFDPSIRTRSPHAVKIDQQVYVKVLSISQDKGRQRISLSMRGVNQFTGELEDIQERGRRSEVQKPAPKKRLTSPERWEIRQLIASGAAKAEDYIDYDDMNDEQTSQKRLGEDPDVEVNIELNFKEPDFLKGQTGELENLEPPKIIKNPDGSLQRAAMNGSTLAKEFKEKRIKEQKEREKEERIAASKSADSFDPIKSKKPQEKPIDISAEWKRSQEKVTYGKRTSLPMKQQRESLPVFSMRDELVSKIKENQFLVIVGETGSGKTTQITQYLAEEGFNSARDGSHKIIGCTQPRQVAATSVAKRVADERGTRLGTDVGYTVRFDDKTSPGTNIKYMTDGMLQREAINDPLMSKYSVIMLDEAHERTIATDVLFALLKKATINNPDLKVIVTSATLDADKFSRFFNSCPVVKIPGRTFPVEVLYTREPEMDYLSAAIDSVLQIHVSEPTGDILVFLTGQEEIDTSCQVLFEKIKLLGDAVSELIILPVYSSLPSEMQSRIFEPTPPGSRKVILATNIAETSITIDGIYYVVDPGFVKINAYDPKLGMDSLVVSPISQAQANQRSGRAGRTGPGKCYRLYTEKAYNEEMLANTVPEIQRTNLSNTILLLKTMGINDLLNFEFMDPPKVQTMLTALQELFNLEALDDDGYLTKLGKKMSNFPMDPKLAKVLIKSEEFGCSEEVLTIVSMLSVQSVFYRPKAKQNLADQRRARFNHSSGDHLSLLNVYRSWVLNGYNKSWCNDNFIQERSMRRAQDVKNQLTKIMNKKGSQIVSSGLDYEKVIKALCSGYFKNAAKRDFQGGYKTLVGETAVYLHPSSSLHHKDPEYVIYHTLLLTTKEYMHCATQISPGDLVEMAPNYFQVSDPNKVNKRQKIVPLYDKFKTEDAWRLSNHISNKKKLLSQDNQ